MKAFKIVVPKMLDKIWITSQLDLRSSNITKYSVGTDLAVKHIHIEL